MDYLKERYSIWRMIGLYITILARSPVRLLGALLLLCIVDLLVVYFENSFQSRNSIGQTAYVFGLRFVGWIPFAIFLVVISRELLNFAKISVLTFNRRYLQIIPIMLISYLLLALLSLAPGAGNFTTFLVLICSSLVHVWFAVGVYCAVGDKPLSGSMHAATMFIANHFGKVLIYLIFMFLFYVALLLATISIISVFLGRIKLAAQLLLFLSLFLSLFLQAFLSPIVLAIYTKVSYFKDDIVPRILK